MTRLLDALAGSFGIYKRVRTKNPHATWEKFISSCLAVRRPNEYVVSFILTGMFRNDFMSDGIKGATRSAWSHSLTCLHGGGDKIKDGLEIVESQALVKADTLMKYQRDDVYLAAFSVSLDEFNFSRLKQNLYSQIGKPYDIAEFMGYLKGAFSVIPNPEDLHVCSTLTAYGVRGKGGGSPVMHRWFGRWEPIRLWRPKDNPLAVTPGDQWAGMNPQFRFRRSFYNCV